MPAVMQQFEFEHEPESKLEVSFDSGYAESMQLQTRTQTMLGSFGEEGCSSKNIFIIITDNPSNLPTSPTCKFCFADIWFSWTPLSSHT